MRALAPRLSIRPGILGSLVAGRCVGRARLERDAPRLDVADSASGRERDLRDRFRFELSSVLLSPKPSTAYLDDDELRLLVDRALEFARDRGFLAEEQGTSLRGHRDVTARGTDDQVLTTGVVDVSRTVDDEVAEAIVWKTSWQPVDATDARLELAALLLALMQEDGVERARGWVHSPRLRQVHVHETTRAEALALVESTVHAAHAPDAPLRAGAWCRRCHARATCPAVALEAEVMHDAFDFPRTVREGSRTRLREHARGVIDAWLADGAIDKLAKLGEQARVLEPALEAVRASIRALLERGDAGGLAERWELRECRGKPRGATSDVRRALEGTLTRSELESATDLRFKELERLYVARLVEEAKARGQELSREVARQLFHAAISPVVETPVHVQLRRRSA